MDFVLAQTVKISALYLVRISSTYNMLSLFSVQIGYFALDTFCLKKYQKRTGQPKASGPQKLNSAHHPL